LLSASSPSAISWIGTIQGFLLIVFGILSGPLYDLGYIKALIAAGLVLVVGGLIAVSFATEYYQVFLSLGLTVGLGSGCMFVPSLAIAASYFTTKRPLATGVTAAGGSVGGVLFATIFRHLLDQAGYDWACRVLGLILAAVLILSLVIARPLRPVPAAMRRRLIDGSALRDPTFLLFSLSMFFVFIGLYVPFFYVPQYAQDVLDTGPQLAFYLLAIQNAGSVLGRILPALVAVRWGPFPVLIAAVCLCSVLCFAWIGIDSLVGIVVFAVLYGFFSGAVVSLPAPALVVISPDLRVVGSRLGMSFSFAGFGLLIGNPIAGLIVSQVRGFVGIAAFTGAVMLVGCAVLSLAFVWHSYTKRQAE
jgi:MFS family permease